ncbi:MAG: hypothetical protein J0L75_13635 [Spirochaetes bacterium]|nr:hypothetical protein [Spirochaetota bacterium]
MNGPGGEGALPLPPEGLPTLRLVVDVCEAMRRWRVGEFRSSLGVGGRRPNSKPAAKVQGKSDT